MEKEYDFSPDDVIAGILAYSELKEMTSSKDKIHKIIFNLKEESKSEHPELLEDLNFPQNNVYPFSRELESILIGLQISGIIEAKNTKYLEYLIDESGREYIKNELIKNFDIEQKEYIKELGKRFNELIKE